MKMDFKKRIQKLVSVMLAAVMMVSVFSVAVPQKAEAATPTLKGSGKSSVSITDRNCYAATGKPTYIKFTSKVDGYVTFTLANNSSLSGGAWGYLTLCNSKKKALCRNNEYFDTNGTNAYLRQRTYGIKKGTTYLLKIQSEGGVKVAASVKAVKKKAGTKRTNAKSIAQGKTTAGYIPAGSKAADWYKIKLTKKQKLKMYYSGKTNGATLSGNYIVYDDGIKFTLYDSKGKPFLSGSNNYDYFNLKSSSTTETYVLRNSLTGKVSGLNPGTYYVKVERYKPTSSGYYTIKWK